MHKSRLRGGCYFFQLILFFLGSLRQFPGPPHALAKHLSVSSPGRAGKKICGTWGSEQTQQILYLLCLYLLGCPKCTHCNPIGIWINLVVSTPPKNMSQLGLLFPIHGKIKAMFQTTSQEFVIQMGFNGSTMSHAFRSTATPEDPDVAPLTSSVELPRSRRCTLDNCFIKK